MASDARDQRRPNSEKGSANIRPDASVRQEVYIFRQRGGIDVQTIGLQSEPWWTAPVIS
jgi:hypothetical protein